MLENVNITQNDKRNFISSFLGTFLNLHTHI